MHSDKEQLKELIRQLDALKVSALELEQKYKDETRKVHPSFKKSVQNLLHYLALRHHDIRHLQENLTPLGLSSLGRAEGHVLASLEAVRRQLCFLSKCSIGNQQVPVSFSENKMLLAAHTEALLGAPPVHRSTRIMVTFATDLATDYELICRLLRAGMNCARINCAHDNKTLWAAMIRNIRRATAETGIPCKIAMDLMGPKLRTGSLKPGPKLLAIHPVRNELGQITAPAQVWLAPAGVVPPSQVDASIPVDATWLLQLQEGDKLRFRDTRGRKRAFSVVRRESGGVVAHLFKTSYLASGIKLFLKGPATAENSTEVGELPALEQPIILKKDQFLILCRNPILGEGAQFDAKGHIVNPAYISCTLPEVFGQVKVGQPILFDDGKIEGVVQEVKEDTLLIKITYASSKGSKLWSDRGINLPESKLRLAGLTAKDKQDLAFILKHADIVGMSFVNNAETVEALYGEIRKLKAKHFGAMFKIETKEGFRNLPHILLKVMQNYPAGIMIARGDLAVECGWQRLAEVQEEILWLCEASHIPVVWATQVLETLAKKGRPSRAEITDAAMAQRADCVMLNKGPHIVQAIQLLDDIMIRMQKHQNKKTSMLRSLHVSEMESQPE